MTTSRSVDDSSSFTSTIYSTSSSSTVPGPGAIAGKFLKALGERSLDLVVYAIIRNRLRTIERTLEKSPEILCNPTGEKEWRRMNHVYNDLSELCRGSQIDYYPSSLQMAAANLVQKITIITRHDDDFNASPLNGRWEALLVDVQHTLRRPGILKDLPESSNSGDPPPIARDPTRKVLVLGAGRAGKSTLVNQIQAITDTSSSQDVEKYRDTIVSQVLMSLYAIISDIDHSDISKELRYTFLLTKDACECMLAGIPSSFSIGDAISTLSHEPAVRRSVCRSKLGMLSGHGVNCMDYFFDSASRIFQPDYRPTREDIVHCRVRTTTIWEAKFSTREGPWLLMDIGGEHTGPMKKWTQCFENATAIIFVVALSDYNSKTLNEGSAKNHMEETLLAFESVVNSPWFTNALIVLLFNKFDLFLEKFDSVPVRTCFPDFKGKESNDACMYFKRRFLSVVQDKTRSVVVKYCCAINRKWTTAIFQSTRDEINLHYKQNTNVL